MTGLVETYHTNGILSLKNTYSINPRESVGLITLAMLFCRNLNCCWLHFLEPKILPPPCGIVGSLTYRERTVTTKRTPCSRHDAHSVYFTAAHALLAFVNELLPELQPLVQRVPQAFCSPPPSQSFTFYPAKRFSKVRLERRSQGQKTVRHATLPGQGDRGKTLRDQHTPELILPAPGSGPDLSRSGGEADKKKELF